MFYYDYYNYLNHVCIFRYDPDLQQLSSVTYTGRHIKTVLSKLKQVQDILVWGDHVFYHSGKELWSVDKRGLSTPVKRESVLPRASHISVARDQPAVLAGCAKCPGICIITQGVGPTCTAHHENSTCPCKNDGKCVVVDGKVVCECTSGYHGNQCQTPLPSSSLSIAVIIAAVIASLFIFLALLYLCYRYKDKLGIKNVMPTNVRYSRHNSSIVTNNSKVPYGMFNEGCEEYDLEELTDQSQLMEKEDDQQEDVI